MKTITQNRLQTSSFDGLAEFYLGALGMTDFSANGFLSFGYETSCCHLIFNKSSCASYVPSPADFYWKSGITVRNLDYAVSYLQNQGVAVSKPLQFMDIGYLAHIQDPQGHIIELLQQGFKGNEQKVCEGHPVGGQATFAHITLRVSDIARCSSFFIDQLSMRLMSIQAVPSRGFTLYFYSWSDEKLPNSDLRAVENREWLWARPYTMIELQHFHDPVTLKIGSEKDPGFKGVCYLDHKDNNLFELGLSDLTALI